MTTPDHTALREALAKLEGSRGTDAWPAAYDHLVKVARNYLPGILDELDALKAKLATPTRAPVQGYAAGIPWSLHLEAYDVYCAKWGKQEAMIDPAKNCRGGFGVRELDQWIPGWRERASELDALKADRDRLLAENARLREGLRPFAVMADHFDNWLVAGGPPTGTVDAADLRNARTLIAELEGAKTS